MEVILLHFTYQVRLFAKNFVVGINRDLNTMNGSANSTVTHVCLIKHESLNETIEKITWQVNKQNYC